MKKLMAFKSFVVSAALVCGFDVVGLAESAVTVEVTATTELGVPSEYRVGFPALEEATPLYIAYGQKDGGAVQIRWDHYEKVADLAAGATSAVVSVPETWSFRTASCLTGATTSPRICRWQAPRSARGLRRFRTDCSSCAPA